MKQARRILSTILAIISVGCIIVVLFIFFKGKADDRRAQELFNEQRPVQTIESQLPSESSSSQQSPEASSETDADQSTAESEADAAQSTAESETPPPESSESVQQPEAVENPYAASYRANKDMAGWLQIPGTVIDYPIMWTPRDENYYLYRDFEGKSNKNGCLILDTDSSVDPLTTNLIIHGHNMKSGAMFGDLTEYEKESYYEEHKEITLYTPQCQRNYEVIAVFRSQVYRKTDDVFKFYKFFQADNEAQFLDFYENIKKLSLYDTGVTAEYGDHFITLSTCVYHVTNGRFVVVAKEVESGDTYLPLTP